MQCLIGWRTPPCLHRRTAYAPCSLLRGWVSAIINSRFALLPPSSGQVSAIISPDKAVVLKSSREKENQNIIAPMLKVNSFCVMAATQQPASICLYRSNVMV